MPVNKLIFISGHLC